jgi:hypothetical protein
MDIRLLTDYMRRYLPGFGLLVPCYAGFATYAASTKEFRMLIIFSYIALFIMGWYFTLDYHRLDIRKTVQSLPVKRDAISRTLWFEAVISPILIGCATMITGIIACSYVAPGIYSYWDLAPYVLVSLLLTNGWSIYLAFIYQKQSGLITEFISQVLFIGYCIFCCYLAYLWNSSVIVKFLVTGSSVLLATWGCWFAPRFLDKMSERKTLNGEQETDHVQVRDLKDQDTSITWYDALMARPILLVMLGSFSLVLLNLGLIGIFGLSTNSQAVEMVLLAFLLISTVTLTIITRNFYISLRVFANLPISRSWLSVYCITLPFMTFFPIATCSFFNFFLFMICYLVTVTIFLGASVFYLRWHTIVSMIFTNIMFVALGFWPMFFFKYSKLGNHDMVRMINNVGISFFALIMIISIIWLWLLLHRSNAPYRKKPAFYAV